MSDAEIDAAAWRIVARAGSLRDGATALGRLAAQAACGAASVRLFDPDCSFEDWLGTEGWRAVPCDEVPAAAAGAMPPAGGEWLLAVGRGGVVILLRFGDRDLTPRLGPLLVEAISTLAQRYESVGGSEERSAASASARVRRAESEEPIVGRSTGLAQVMQRVEMVARQDVPVLLLGETGTGKEVIARALHARSRRADRPFVRVNCGAIPRELVDSELFGHERGAFTGAVDRRRGWFERADGGTLLLDEIGELPIEAQVRLLRILQDGSFTRVGGAGLVTVDVRIVAATHQDLPGMVDRRAFREDLWYRIATFPIRLPPLRERRGDIAELARHFIHKASVRFGLPAPELNAESLRAMEAYAWPGNTRELGAVIDRAMILGDGHRLEMAAALGLGLRDSGTTMPGNCGDALIEAKPARSISLEQAQRQHIERALKACHGRVEGPFGAAKLLEVNPHTLRSRMRRLGIDWAGYRVASDQRAVAD